MQRRVLRLAGVRSIYAETASGARQDRPQLQRLLADLVPGDEVVVYRIDRLARSLFDLLGILRGIEAAGARFRSLTEPFDTATPMGRLVVQLLGVIAEFERAVILERSAAGRAAARARGVKFGRPRKLDYEAVARLSRQGLSVDRIAQRLGESRGSVHWALSRMRRLAA